MEAVPRLPMISFELKASPENVDFASKLNQLIMTKFGEDPSSFHKEIRELETLRANSCIRVAETIDGVATLKNYFCQLKFLKNRFKVGVDGPFQFSWRDVYGGSDYIGTDVNYELAAVLYNIGALHTKLGVGEKREESEGMKMAVTHFQCAAWAFHSLPDLFPQDPESDLASDLLAFKSGLCLAQAQECILEKSILDSRKPGIVTKVCGQVVEYYKQSLRQMEVGGKDGLLDIVDSKQVKSWLSFLKFKVEYYGALGWLHQGMSSEDSQRMGERVTYYQAASDSLVSAIKFSEKLDGAYKEVRDALQYTADVINGKLDNAKKENEFIYHEKVPELDSLPPIKGASLVKGIPFDSSDPEVSGPDLFSRLVPLEAHEASSLYSEEQAKLLRNVCGEIETANDTLVVYLSSLQLEDIPSLELDKELPQELIECAAGLSVRSEAVGQLQEAMAKLASVSADVEASLTEIQSFLKEEEENEKNFQQLVGQRPTSIIRELERETQKYHEAHSMASESNLTLHKAMQLHVKNLKLLSQPLSVLQTSIPSLSQLDQGTETSMAEMRRIMDKVDEMRKQRTGLEMELRDGVHQDDITETLAHQGDKGIDKIFEEELKKHERTVQLIRQNISAQENIIRAMTERNAEYADARIQVDDLVNKRDDVIGSLVASYHAYEDLLAKTMKGLEFYDKLEANVTKLLARVSGVVKVQEEERNQQLATNSRKSQDAKALSLKLVSEGGYLPAAPPPVSGGGGYLPAAPPPVSGGGYLPAAPPLESPDKPLEAPKVSSGGRPKLSDYLNAKKSVERDNKREDKSPDTVVPAIRPQPVGSESEPSFYQLHTSQPGSGYNHSSTHVSHPSSSLLHGQVHPVVSSAGSQQPFHYYPQSVGYPYGQHHMVPQDNQNKQEVNAGSNQSISSFGYPNYPSISSNYAGISQQAKNQTPSPIKSTAPSHQQYTTGTSYGFQTPAVYSQQNIVTGQLSPSKVYNPSLKSDMNRALASGPLPNQPTIPNISQAKNQQIVNQVRYGADGQQYLQASHGAPAYSLSGGVKLPSGQQPYITGNKLPPTFSSNLPTIGQIPSNLGVTTGNSGTFLAQSFASPNNQISSSQSHQAGHQHEVLKVGQLNMVPQAGQVQLVPQAGQHYGVLQAAQHVVPQAGQHGVQQTGQNAVPQTGHHAVPQAGQYGVPQAGQYGVPQAGHQDVPRAEQQHGVHPAGKQHGIPQAGQQHFVAQSGQHHGIPQAGQQQGVPQAGQQQCVPHAGQQQGVLQAGQNQGVPQAGQQQGVPQAVQQHGNLQAGKHSILQTGQQHGVSQGGQQHGITQVGHQQGIPQAGHLQGIPQAGQQHGIPQDGKQHGVPQTGYQHGVPQTGYQINVSQAGYQHGVLQTGQQHGVSSNASAGTSSIPVGPKTGVFQNSNYQVNQGGVSSIQSFNQTTLQPAVTDSPLNHLQMRGGQEPLFNNQQGLPPVSQPHHPGVGSVQGNITQNIDPRQQFLHQQTEKNISINQNIASSVYYSQNPPLLSHTRMVGPIQAGQQISSNAQYQHVNLPTAISQSMVGTVQVGAQVPNISAPHLAEKQQPGNHQQVVGQISTVSQAIMLPQTLSTSNNPQQAHTSSIKTLYQPNVGAQSTSKPRPEPTTVDVKDVNKAPSNVDLLSGLASLPIGQVNIPAEKIIPPAQLKPVVPMPGGKQQYSGQHCSSETTQKPFDTPHPSGQHYSYDATQKPAEQLHYVSEEDRLAKLTSEAERLQVLLASLSSKTLGGQSPLETKWREILERVDSSDNKRNVSVARCYPEKNRVPDVLPFDQTRVELKGLKDDYINASRIDCPWAGPSAIVTQAPSKKGSVSEFWHLVWQESVETLVCLVPDMSLAGNYLPNEQQPVEISDLMVSLQSIKTTGLLTERVVNITSTSGGARPTTRALVHLQMAGWPGPDFPSSPACLLDTAVAVVSLLKQQRVSSRPFLLHCLDGGSKSGTFLVLLWLLVEMTSSGGPQIPSLSGWPDICDKVSHILQQRKGIIRDKHYLRLVHEALLYYIQDVLMKQGILKTGSSVASKKTHSRHPSEDFVALATAGKICLDREQSNLSDKDNSIVMEATNIEHVVETEVIVKDPKDDKPDIAVSNIPEDLTQLANISISESTKQRKITKEDFLRRDSGSGLSKEVDPTDPLSLIDPLWSLK